MIFISTSHSSYIESLLHKTGFANNVCRHRDSIIREYALVLEIHNWRNSLNFASAKPMNITFIFRLYVPVFLSTLGKLQLPRKSSSSANVELPSARLISTSMTQESNVADAIHSVLVMQMGQFIDHDITHTPNHGQSCCNKDGSFPSE